MCFRHTLSQGEDYGRGPGTMLAPDIRMLNEMRRDVIEAANMAVDPPTLLHADNILGEFRLQPGSRNYGGVDDNGRQMAIPYQNGADPRITQEMVQDVRTQIDDAMLGGVFRVLQENPNMKATTAALLAQQQGQMTAPAVGRGQTEYLDPMMRRESGILKRQGLHPEWSPKLINALREMRQTLQVQYDSPLTRAARSGEGVGIMQTLEALAPWGQIVGPEVFADFNPRKVAQVLADVNGAPASVMFTNEEREAQEEQAAQQAALQSAVDIAPVAAETAKTIADMGASAQSVPQALPV